MLRVARRSSQKHSVLIVFLVLINITNLETEWNQRTRQIETSKVTIMKHSYCSPKVSQSFYTIVTHSVFAKASKCFKNDNAKVDSSR